MQKPKIINTEIIEINKTKTRRELESYSNH